ncbi:MAG: ArnT family glycosyltransferase [Actinomycetota bacterium]
MRRLPRREHIVLLLIVVAFSASVGHQIAQRVPFENDESVCAVQARAWAAGGPVTGVGLQRAPLLPAIGTLIYKAGWRSEAPYRFVGLAFGIAAVVLVWALGRAVAGEAAGLFAAAVFASAPTIQQRSAQFMTDVPATAVLLAFALVLWHNRARADSSLVLSAPLAAAAVYMRYASVLPIGLLVIVALVLWRRALLQNRALVVGILALFAALLVPHVVRAIDATGTPWGLITHTARFAGRAYLGQGLVQYLSWWPLVLAGPLAGIVMIAGIAGAVTRRTQRAAFLVLPAAADVLLIGLTEHGEPRLIFFPVALLCVAGAAVVVDLVRRPRALSAVAAAALVGAGVFVSVHNEHARAARVVPALAGRAIAHPDLAVIVRRPCIVFSVELAETTWYSGCAAYYFNAPVQADFAVLFRTGGSRLRAQPAEPPPGAGPSTQILYNGRVVATVYRFAPPVQ